MSPMGPGCVRTFAGQKCTELFSPLSLPNVRSSGQRRALLSIVGFMRRRLLLGLSGGCRAWRALQQRAQSGCRFVNQGLLVAIEHFIAHWGYEGTRLTPATLTQFRQLLHDGLGDGACLRYGHDLLCRNRTHLCVGEPWIDKSLECRLKVFARSIYPPEAKSAECFQHIEKDRHRQWRRLWSSEDCRERSLGVPLRAA
jgi:hypothetical protein